MPGNHGRVLLSFRALRLIAIVLPISFAVAVGFLTDTLFEEMLPHIGAHIAATLMISVAAIIFATWIFTVLERAYRELEAREEDERRHAREWQELFETGREITASPDLRGLLTTIVGRAGGLLGADASFAMLCSPADDCTLHMVASHGLRSPVEELVLPASDSVEGLVMESGAPITIADTSDPRLSAHQTTFMAREGLASQLSVPLAVKGKLLGTLTVANRQPTQFADRCVELLSAFANWAAVAVETSNLYAQLEDMARMEERERIGMELHDAVIQSIYAVQLNIHDCVQKLERAPGEVAACLQRATEDLDGVAAYMRRYIFGLRPYLTGASDLPRALRDLVKEVAVNSTIDAEAEIRGDVDGLLTEEQARDIFVIAEQAVSNAVRHAQAATLRLELMALPHEVTLLVADNGNGFEAGAAGPANKRGLREMTDRANALNARLLIESGSGAGTRVSVRIPLWAGGGDGAEGAGR